LDQFGLVFLRDTNPFSFLDPFLRMWEMSCNQRMQAGVMSISETALGACDIVALR
jgi:hypothetical protein